MARKLKRIQPQSGFVTYLRTSDEEVQAPERSQDAQRRDIQQRLISYHNLINLGEYKDNYTGTSADRKDYQRMLSDARVGKFSYIFVAVPDRFGRNEAEALRAIDEMASLGVKIRFASHPDLDPEDPDDRLYLNILFGMARRESGVISRRVRGGMLSKLLQGEWPWRAPDGYVNREIKVTELNIDERLQHARYKRWVEIDLEQSRVWRFAWDMLLQDKPTLEDICEALAAHGYRMRNGKPFIRINGKGQRFPSKMSLSNAFHNWFYAGWVVAENDWANIAPKTVRGQWQPIVTTEEFELGLGILARRNQKPTPQKKNFYLLQGLIYMEMPDGELIKLTCGRPNAGRTQNGVSYYCIPSSPVNFPCADVDAQVPDHMQRIQIDPDLVPKLRRSYAKDATRHTTTHAQEIETLKRALARAKEKELNLWRAFTEHGMQAEMYQQLAREYQDEQKRIQFALNQINQENREYIANLDAALAVIAQIGERFGKQIVTRQRDILRQVVGKVVINPGGNVLRLELIPPFTYLRELADGGNGSKHKAKKTIIPSENETSNGETAGCSFHVDFCDPGRTRTYNLLIKSQLLCH